MKPRRIAAIAIGALLYLGVASLLTASAAHIDTDRGSAAAAGMVVVQADEDTQANEQVPSDEIKKYVAVYIAMQRDHNLTVEQAAAAQGLTVAAFRGSASAGERRPANSAIAAFGGSGDEGSRSTAGDPAAVLSRGEGQDCDCGSARRGEHP